MSDERTGYAGVVSSRIIFSLQDILDCNLPELIGTEAVIGTQSIRRYAGLSQRYIRKPTERTRLMSGDSVYRITKIIGTSKVAWEDAAKNAVETASKTLRDLSVWEIAELDTESTPNFAVNSLWSIQ